MTETTVRIKPLQWTDQGTAAGYKARAMDLQGPRAFMLSWGGRIVGHFDTIEEAKAAAQDDHEEWVRSYLEPTTLVADVEADLLTAIREGCVCAMCVRADEADDEKCPPCLRSRDSDAGWPHFEPHGGEGVP